MAEEYGFFKFVASFKKLSLICCSSYSLFYRSFWRYSQRCVVFVEGVIDFEVYKKFKVFCFLEFVWWFIIFSVSIEAELGKNVELGTNANLTYIFVFDWFLLWSFLLFELIVSFSLISLCFLKTDCTLVVGLPFFLFNP